MIPPLKSYILASTFEKCVMPVYLIQVVRGDSHQNYKWEPHTQVTIELLPSASCYFCGPDLSLPLIALDLESEDLDSSSSFTGDWQCDIE